MINAPATTFEPENSPDIVDFGECALDDQGRAGWPEVIALQAHIQNSRLLAEISCESVGDGVRHLRCTAMRQSELLPWLRGRRRSLRPSSPTSRRWRK